MENVTCSNCGQSNLSNNKYCSSCGHALPKVQTEVPSATLQQPIQDKKKVNWKTLIGLAVGIGTMFAVQHFFFGMPSYDKAMMEFASELNKTCPVMVDAATRLDNAIALPPNVFQYNFSVLNLEKATVDTVAMRNAIEPHILSSVKTNPQMQIQRDHKTTLNYYYKDKDGQFLLMISVTPDMYE